MRNIVDYITYAEKGEIRPILSRMGLKAIESPKIKVDMDHGIKLVSLAVTRCTSREEILELHQLEEGGALRILGKVVDGKYEFHTDADQDMYEQIMEVGEHRKQVAVIRNGEAVIETTTHPYQFGVFF